MRAKILLVDDDRDILLGLATGQRRCDLLNRRRRTSSSSIWNSPIAPGWKSYNRFGKRPRLHPSPTPKLLCPPIPRR